MKNVIVWGGSYQAKVIAPMLRENDLNVIAVFDDSEKLPSSPYPFVPIYKGVTFSSWIREMSLNYELYSVVTVAWPNGEFRERKSEELYKRFDVSPVSTISDSAIVHGYIGRGSMVMPGAIIQVNAKIGPYALINTGAIVEHDCRLGTGCEVAPGAVLLGDVTMGNYSTVFANATVFPHVTIGHRATIGAGSVVMHDIPDGEVWVGNPARRLR